MLVRWAAHRQHKAYGLVASVVSGQHLLTLEGAGCASSAVKKKLTTLGMRSCSRKCYWITSSNQASFNAQMADNFLSISWCTKSKASLEG